MLLQEIKKANMEALKTKDSNARAIYSVLINKCMLLEINKRETVYILFYVKNLAFFPQVESETKNGTPQIYKI